MLDDAFDEARTLDDEFVSVEHLVLALDLVPREALLGALKEVRGGQRVTTRIPKARTRRCRSSAVISPPPPSRGSSTP